MYEVIDLETLKGIFTYTGLDIKTEKISQFIIHKNLNQLPELISHLEKLQGMISFNGLNFDYPILHYILQNYKQWDKLSNSEIILKIYTKAQDIINAQDKEDFNTIVAIPQKNWYFKNLDLFKLWHYNNKARSTSLKALEISMNMDNVMEMPISHTQEVISGEEAKSILEYNLYDVVATYQFYKRSLEKVELRKIIQAKYDLPCMNWNNGKIGEQLILKLYCEKTNKKYWDVKNQRTYRSEIALRDCVPNNIKFDNAKFNTLLEYFNSKTVTSTKGSVDYSLIHKGIKYYYGTGGIHAAIKCGIYESDDHFIIKSCDVASLYPSLATVYQFTIEHLGKEFLEVYEKEIVGVRLAEKRKPKKEQDKSIIDGYKEAANIPYGKSNDENSFLYDPLYTMKTTIAGQLVISMLCEQLANIPNSQILMVNTDGLEIKIPRIYEAQYNDICKAWENHTKLVLEFIDYKKMIIGDINNYIAESMDGKIKNKGRFEVEKVIGGEPAYHKDNSFKIIPLALEKFFISSIPVEETIRNHKNIFDFCGRQKFKGGDIGQVNTIKYDTLGNPYNHVEVQQKNVRYYISTNGSTFIKRYKKGTSEFINKGFKVTIFNKYVEQEDYSIDTQFYIKECYKEINQIVSKQTSLF